MCFVVFSLSLLCVCRFIDFIIRIHALIVAVIVVKHDCTFWTVTAYVAAFHILQCFVWLFSLFGCFFEIFILRVILMYSTWNMLILLPTQRMNINDCWKNWASNSSYFSKLIKFLLISWFKMENKNTHTVAGETFSLRWAAYDFYAWRKVLLHLKSVYIYRAVGICMALWCNVGTSLS